MRVNWVEMGKRKPRDGDRVWLYHPVPGPIDRYYREGTGGTNPNHWTHWAPFGVPEPPVDGECAH